MTNGLENVLWLGGPPGSGKTAVARPLARRHGLRFARPWAPVPEDISEVVLPFSCECAHDACDERVSLAVSDFPAPPDDTSPPLLAEGHDPVEERRPGHALSG